MTSADVRPTIRQDPIANRPRPHRPVEPNRATPPPVPAQKSRAKRPERIPLRWHTRPDGSERALFPDLKPWQVRLLFDRAEADREAHPRKKRTVLHYGGHRFAMDGTILGLRLWFRKMPVSRRFGLGL